MAFASKKERKKEKSISFFFLSSSFFRLAVSQLSGSTHSNLQYQDLVRASRRRRAPESKVVSKAFQYTLCFLAEVYVYKLLISCRIPIAPDDFPFGIEDYINA